MSSYLALLEQADQKYKKEAAPKIEALQKERIKSEAQRKIALSHELEQGRKDKEAMLARHKKEEQAKRDLEVSRAEAKFLKPKSENKKFAHMNSQNAKPRVKENYKDLLEQAGRIDPSEHKKLQAQRDKEYDEIIASKTKKQAQPNTMVPVAKSTKFMPITKDMFKQQIPVVKPVARNNAREVIVRTLPVTKDTGDVRRNTLKTTFAQKDSSYPKQNTSERLHNAPQLQQNFSKKVASRSSTLGLQNSKNLTRVHPGKAADAKISKPKLSSMNPYARDNDEDDLDVYKAMGLKRRRYAPEDDNSDDDMEAGWDDLYREEQRSTRIGKMEDIEEERKLQEEERLSKLKKKQKSVRI